MTETQLLFLAIALIYLGECLIWVPREAIVFIAFFRASARAYRAGALPGGRKSGVALANPLPPLGAVFVCWHWPLSVSPAGVCSRPAQGPEPGAWAERQEIYVPFASMKKIEARGKELRINDGTFIAGISPGQVAYLARFLEGLREKPEKARAAAIRSELLRITNATSVAERNIEFGKQSRILQFACNGLFAYLFLVVPLVVLLKGIVPTWPFLLVILLYFTSLISIEYWLLHRTLYPREREARWTRTLTMLISPPSAIRARDELSRDLLAAFDPVAVAKALCSRTEFEKLTARVIRALEHPLPTPSPGPQNDAALTEAYFRAELRRALDAMLLEASEDPAYLSEVPERDSPDCHSYCPRCQAQYTEGAGTCADCPGLALQPFPDDAALPR